MDKQIVSQVQDSWKLIEENGDEFVRLFYDNLFTINPDLQALFKRNMVMQGRKIMSMFSTAVEYLGDKDKMALPLRASGERHSDHYGVSNSDYADVSSAWIMTMEQMLGDQFTSELKISWQITLEIIQRYMMGASK